MSGNDDDDCDDGDDCDNTVGDDGDNGAARPNGKRCRHLFPLIATPPDMRRIHGVSQSNNGKRKFSLRNANN